MGNEELQAARELIEFANDHAREVFGDNEQREYGSCNGDAILEAADILEAYLDR